MDESDNPKLARRTRDWDFLMAAAHVLGVGIVYFVVGKLLSGAFVFQGIVVVTILLMSGGLLALWWYSGTDPSAP